MRKRWNTVNNGTETINLVYYISLNLQIRNFFEMKRNINTI